MSPHSLNTKLYKLINKFKLKYEMYIYLFLFLVSVILETISLHANFVRKLIQ